MSIRREIDCLHHVEFIFLALWPYGLDSGAAIGIHSNTLFRRTGKYETPYFTGGAIRLVYERY